VKHPPGHAQSRRVSPSARAPRPAGRPADRSCTASEAFEVLWRALADVLGPTATAALMQRSVKRASASEPELSHVVIAREQFVYTYTLPASWKQTAPTPGLRQVVRQLWPLLSELTGSVVIQRLRQDATLQRCGVIPEDAEQ
jgi:hypothetical protein